MTLIPIEYTTEGCYLIAELIACHNRRVLRAMFDGDVGAFAQWLAQTTIGGYADRLHLYRRIYYRIGSRMFEFVGGGDECVRAIEIT
jgi:hypothetical protein